MKAQLLILSSTLLASTLLGGCYLEDPSGCTGCTPTSGVGSLDEDDDGDGFTEGDGDCDDADADTHPHASEPGDGVDNDCDGSVDEGSATQPPEGSPTPTATATAPDPGQTPTQAPTGAPTDAPTDPPPTAEPTPAPTPTAFPEAVETTPEAVFGPDEDAERAAVLSDLRFIGDFDEDGYDDFAASVQLGTEGRVYLFYGGPDRLGEAGSIDAEADAVILGVGAPDTNGIRLAAGGDVDGDGTDDILLGDIYQRRANLFLGAATRRTGEIDADGAAATFYSFVEGSYGVGLGMAIVPDMDGDGHAEIAIGVPAYDLGRGEVDLFYGRADFTGVIDVATADARFRGNVQEGATGSQVFGLGDLDGDGRGDLGITSSTVPHGPDTTVTRGTFTLIYGEATREAGIQDLVGRPTLYAPYSTSLVGMSLDTGDMDGDGHRDAILGIPTDGAHTGQAWLLYGAGYRLTNGNFYLDEIAVPVTGRDDRDVAFGSSSALAGDVIGSGTDDLVIASPRLREEVETDGEETPAPSEVEAGPGYVVLFAGNPQRTSWSAAEHAWGYLDGASLGYDALWPVATGGDLDGDGRSELLVGATKLSLTGEAFSSVLVVSP